MNTVSTLLLVFASLEPAFTRPTFENFIVLLRGAVLARGPRTVSNCLRAAWPWAQHVHFSTYENLLRRARYSLYFLGALLFREVLTLLSKNAVIELAVDETLVRRYGPQILGIGMHRDAVRSSHGYRIATPGHKWVVVSVVVALPFLSRSIALPVASALYTPAQPPKRNRRGKLREHHHTPLEIALTLIKLVVGWAPGRTFRILGDGSYATHTWADALQAQSASRRLRRVRLVSRLRLDASLYDDPPVYNGLGRPRKKGVRLPSPQAVAADPTTRWHFATVAWYGATRKRVQWCVGEGRWYKCGNLAKKIYWVLVRDPDGKRDDTVLMTTDETLSSIRIIEAFVRRWALEVTFEEARRELGLETCRNWSEGAVRRSVPLGLGLYTLVVLWFAKHVKDPDAYKQAMPWYKKPAITFSDMLAAARQEVWREAPRSAKGKTTFEEHRAKSGEFLVPLPMKRTRPVKRRQRRHPQRKNRKTIQPSPAKRRAG